MTTPTDGQPVDCERCGQPHGRCRAHNRAGQPCGRLPSPGQAVCVMHGAKTPGARERAVERQQTEAAESELRKLWVGLDAAAPVADPVVSMARLAGALEQFLDVVGGRLNELRSLAAGEAMAQMRGELVLWERTARLLTQLLDAMARHGIAERAVELQQAQAAIVVVAFRAALEAGGRDLLPVVREAMTQACLAELGTAGAPS